MRYRKIVALAVVMAVMAGSVAGGGRSIAATSYDAEELQLLRLINDYRAKSGLGPLLLSDRVAVAAKHHSRDMGRYGFFTHRSVRSSYYAAGSTPRDRMSAAGYDYNTRLDENLAAAYKTAEKAFKAWRASPKHNAAMLDGRYEVIGIARLNVPGSKLGWYWTTDFGGHVDPSAHRASRDSDRPHQRREPQRRSGPDHSPIITRADVPLAGNRRERDRPERKRDRGGVENGSMTGGGVWKQKTVDGARLITRDDIARLGNYNSGRDELWQRIRVKRGDRLVFRVRVHTRERIHAYDMMSVRVEGKGGKRIDTLVRYTDAHEGKWRRESIDLSRLAGRTIRLSFLARTDEIRPTAFFLDDVRVKD